MDNPIKVAETKWVTGSSPYLKIGRGPPRRINSPHPQSCSEVDSMCNSKKMEQFQTVKSLTYTPTHTNTTSPTNPTVSEFPYTDASFTVRWDLRSPFTILGAWQISQENTHDMFPLWKSYRKRYTLYKMVDLLLFTQLWRSCTLLASKLVVNLTLVGTFWGFSMKVINTSDNVPKCSAWLYTWSTGSWTKQDIDMLICICIYYYSFFDSLIFPPVMEDIRTLIHRSSYSWMNSTPLKFNSSPLNMMEMSETFLFGFGNFPGATSCALPGWNYCLFVGFACSMLGRSSKHILPNCGLKVIYHGTE